jgi:mRNA interferase RelE/StbE
MAYNVETLPSVDKAIRKLDGAARESILTFLATKLPKYEDPRSIGKALKGQKYGEFWRYEVGGFRIIAKIEDKRFLILVVKIGNWKNVYKKQ